MSRIDIYLQTKKTYKKSLITKMVPCTEFESVNAALRGQCVKPLHQQGKSNEQYNTIINKKEKQEFISLFF